jgi:hypothetical protein
LAKGTYLQIDCLSALSSESERGTGLGDGQTEGSAAGSSYLATLGISSSA